MKVIKRFFSFVLIFIFTVALTFCAQNVVSAASSFEVTDVTVGETSEGAHAYISGFEGLSIENRVIFHAVDDYVDLVLTVKNNSKNLRKITDIVDNNTNTFVSYSYNKHTGEEVAPGERFELTIRITCLEVADTPEELTQENPVEFNITFEETITEPAEGETDPENNTDEEETKTNTETKTETIIVSPLVPDTGAGPTKPGFIGDYHSTTIIAIAITGASVILAGYFFIKKKARITVLLSVLSITLATFLVPLTVSANDNIETINLNSVIGLRNILHIKAAFVVDEVSRTDLLDTYVPFEQIVGMGLTYQMFNDMMISDVIPARYTIEKIEYSNGVDDEQPTMGDLISDDLFITAYLNSNLTRYNITYELNGGTNSSENPTSYTEDDDIRLQRPTKEGYFFTGWTSPDLIETPEPSVYFYGDELKRDIVFVANWREARTFEITYELDGGTVSEPNPTTYKEGTPGFTVHNPTKEDWIFEGWTVNGSDVKQKELFIEDIEENITITAHFKRVYLRFTEDTYWKNSSPEVPKEPVIITKDAEIRAPNAYWVSEEDNEFIIKFDAWYQGRGWVDCMPDSRFYCTGTHYYAGDVIKPAGYMPENDITLFAGWLPVEHPITYDLGEGGYLEGEYRTTYTIIDDFIFPIPKRDGYGFVGWDVQGLVEPSNNYHYRWHDQLAGRGPMTVKAIWEEGAQDLTHIEYLQDAKYTNCALTPIGTVATLKDRRDGKNYRVKRLSDDRCWMIDNLALENATLDSSNSDITGDTVFTLPESNINKLSPYYAVPTNVAVYINPDNNTGYYTFNAATAGSGGTISTTDTQNAPYSICPKGWKLPTATTREDGEFMTLFNTYEGESLFSGANSPEISLYGWYNFTEFRNNGEGALYWLGTAKGREDGYAFHIYNDSTSLRAWNYDEERYNGLGVRCQMWD